jgi:predicted phage tail protein
VTLPIIGYKGGKGGGGSQRTPVEAADTLRSRASARVLDLIAEGEIEGFVNGLQSVYLDETPIQNANGTFNFDGVTVYFVPGTQDQQYIPGFSNIESEFAVATEVKVADPVVRTINNPSVNAVRVRISIPALSSLNTTTGDLTGTTVQFAIDVQSSGGEFQAAPLSAGWLSANLSGGIVSMSQAGTGIAASVTWNKPSDQYSPFVQPPRRTITYDVEFRLQGAVAWQLYKRESITDDDFRTRGNQAGAFVAGPFGLPAPSNPGGQVGFQPFGIPLYQQNAIPARIYEISNLASGKYELRVSKVSGDGTLSISNPRVYVPINHVTITDKASSKYERSYYIPLTGSAPWNIRLRRITPDSTSSALNNKTVFEAYTEIIERKLRYPNSALVGLIVDSSHFSAVPQRAYHVKLLRIQVPSNYDPILRTYSGIWDGTFKIAWSNNPAWCFYDLATNTRYGLGRYLDPLTIDKWTLYTIGKYCDELVHDGFGGLEPRFTCNIYWQTQEEAFDVLSAMASVFRGLIYWAEGKIVPVQDAPASADFQFSVANVIDGLFTYSGSSRRARHTVALVSWNDPENFYRQKVEYVEDAVGIARYGVVETDVVSVGCTSRGQAHRIGKWLLYSEINESEVVTFRTGLYGAAVRPGNIIQINDSHRAGLRFSGRVVSATTNAVTLDAPVTIEALAGLDYTLSCMIAVSEQWESAAAKAIGDRVYSRAPNLHLHFECTIAGTTGTNEPVFNRQIGGTTQDGDITWTTRSNLQERFVTNDPGSHTTLNVAAPFTVAPEPQTIWILISSALQASKWRALSIAEVEPHLYEIAAVAHNPNKFAAIEENVVLEMPSTSVLTGTPLPPSGLVLDELLINFRGRLTSVLTIKWNAVAGAKAYAIEYRKDQGTWIKLPDQLQPYAEVVDIIPGAYQVRLVAINQLGNPSAPLLKSRLVLGKANPPQNVSGFAVARSSGILKFSWQHIADADLDYYELRRGSTWESAIPLGETISNHFDLDTNSGGTYLLKAFDTSGNQSALAAVIIAPNYANVNVVVNDDDKDAGWPGTKVNVSVDGGNAIVLAGRKPWAEFTQPWATYTGDWFASSVPFTDGSYTTDVLDLGDVLNSRVEIIPTIEQQVLGGRPWASYTDPWFTYTEPWAGTPGKISATFEIRTSNDNVIFTAWAPFVTGFYSARYLQVRANLATLDINYLPRMTSLLMKVDVPDRVLHFEDASVPSSGLHLTFTPPFVNVQTVQVTIQGGLVGDDYRVTNKNNDGCDVQVFNSAGTAKAGVLDVDAFGYGERP